MKNKIMSNTEKVRSILFENIDQYEMETSKEYEQYIHRIADEIVRIYEN